jgi:hypothetical protein
MRYGVALAAAVVGCTTWAVPAPAATPTWHDAGPQDVSDVTFHAVAATPGAAEPTVVAVGQDAAKRAVIYRRVGKAWVQDHTGPVDSCLVEVAVTGDSAWAVGSEACSTAAATPYVVRAGAGGWTALSSATSPASWEKLAVPDSLKPATAVTLVPGTAGAKSGGYVGDAAGNVFRIADATVAAPIGSTAVAYKADAAAKLTSVTGLSATAAGAAFATGPSTVPAGGGGVFAVAGDEMSPAAFQPNASASAPVDIAALAAPNTTASVAIEAAAHWRPDAAGVWARTSSSSVFDPQTTQLRDAALAVAGGRVVAALAGATEGGGAVWVRLDAGPWTSGDLGWTTVYSVPGVLNGVAVVSRNDLWAVGANGAVKRFAPPPTVEGGADDDDGGNGGNGGNGEDGDNDGGSGGSGDPHAGASGSTPRTTVIERPPAGAPKSDPKPGAKPKPKAGRVLRNVRVRVLRGRLVISFRLAARARVAARAMRAGKLVGVARARVLRRGTGQLVLRFRGRKAPTQLQLIVRPAPAGRAGGR